MENEYRTEKKSMKESSAGLTLRRSSPGSAEALANSATHFRAHFH
jgi:hypothetical protein